MVRDDGCTAEWLSEIVQSLIAEPGRLAQMAVAAAATGHRDAAQKVAELVESVSKGAA
jgi:UDP-N-acetylglucosamine:LPS N-acetylglucosamine transferase